MRKLLTLNTHSLVGGDWEGRSAALAAALLREAPDVIALQEVNQGMREEPIGECEGILPRQNEIPLRCGNCVYDLARTLAEQGLSYSWCWLPAKRGYGGYDEGLAFLSKERILKAEGFYVSRIREYENWKTRMVLGIQTEAGSDWYFNAHMSWWEDMEEPFAEQWLRLTAHLEGKELYWLMGDLNNPPHRRNEGYDLLCRYGLWDCYESAACRRGEATAKGRIDGWRGRAEESSLLRIDQIWCSRPPKVVSYQTLFDGIQYEPVSDHFGVQVTIQE